MVRWLSFSIQTAPSPAHPTSYHSPFSLHAVRARNDSNGSQISCKRTPVRLCAFQKSRHDDVHYRRHQQL